MQSIQEHCCNSFSPSTFCPIFFHLDISRHVLGTFHAPFGRDTSVKGLRNMLQDVWHATSGTHNMQG
jgi:hypothetical protein